MERQPSSAGDQDIVYPRVFAVPRARLFAAFSDPAQMVHWWGPNGFTNTNHEFDLRVGGTWRLTMHGPDGKNYDNEKKFTEVVVPERVAFRHYQPMHDFTMTMIYDEVEGGTRLTWRMHFETGPVNDNLRAFLLKANAENFDRLEAWLVRSAA